MAIFTQRKRKKTVFGLFNYPTRKLRGEPDFLIVGAEKAGTTSLHDYINQHPEVAESHRKEIQYFSRYFYRSYDWYRAHFPLRSNLKGKICGEASPYYLFHPYAPERIHGTLPQVKIIMLLREPIARSVSQYHHEVSKDREHLSIEEAFSAEESRTRGELERMKSPLYLPFNHEHFSYMKKSDYSDQVSRYLRVFPREQLLILQSEEFFKNSAEVIQQVFLFLGIDPEFMPSNLSPSNVSRRKKSQLPEELREELSEHFREKNEELYRLLGRRYDW